jgi:hypothetical protein
VKSIARYYQPDCDSELKTYWQPKEKGEGKYDASPARLVMSAFLCEMHNKDPSRGQTMALTAMLLCLSAFANKEY